MIAVASWESASARAVESQVCSSFYLWASDYSAAISTKPEQELLPKGRLGLGLQARNVTSKLSKVFWEVHQEILLCCLPGCCNKSHYLSGGLFLLPSFSWTGDTEKKHSRFRIRATAEQWAGQAAGMASHSIHWQAEKQLNSSSDQSREKYS